MYNVLCVLNDCTIVNLPNNNILAIINPLSTTVIYTRQSKTPLTCYCHIYAFCFFSDMEIIILKKAVDFYYSLKQILQNLIFVTLIIYSYLI